MKIRDRQVTDQPASIGRKARRETGVTLTALRAFVAVVDSKSFSQAARVLRVSQPSVSVQLAVLEEACGVLLCHRKPEISLTEAGRDLYVRARLALSRVDEFESAALELHASTGGRLAIGLSAPHVAMRLIATFMKISEQTRLLVSIGNTQTLLADISRCAIDVGIMTLVEPVPNLACTLIESPLLTVCMRADDPLARRRAVAAEDLVGRPFVLREQGSRTRQNLEATFESAGVKLLTRLEVPTREAMREAVAAGIGLGALFEGEVGADARLVCVPFRSQPVSSGVYAVTLKESLGIPAVGAFFDHIVSGGRISNNDKLS